ncbi:ROK family protein [Agarivorans sp. 1_MG-2023]|uniref:ROK family protein n=1 Tax=Agarivorans sp. 1_MG-2023 TaxID=3062634 RepID=UPI0026E3DA4A|nr:ROK family protein [Agarivorans sp. 1_MG-2023]MDO6764169.1 ROK family protein [Agarivorans sp. 1_MG-2023]
MNDKLIVNVDKVKQVNTAAVYGMIDQLGPISRVKVAEQSQLAPASVTKITRQLLATGLIKEVAQQASTGGRRAISLMTEQSHYYFISVRLGRGTMDISLFDLSGISHAHSNLDVPEVEQDALVNTLLNNIDSFIQQHLEASQNLIAVAVTLSGLVNPGEGTVVYTPHYQLRDCPLASLIEARFSLPAYVGNDTRAMALAEHYFGATKDVLDSILISVHSGTGAGIIVNGQVFMSQNRDVGEIGHIQVDPLGDKCQCGNVGCLETIVSNTAIVERLKTLISQGCPSILQGDFNIEDVCAAANQGDMLCHQVLHRVGKMLGNSIAITINLFHPQKIILAGEIMAAQNILLPTIKQCIEHQALSSFAEDLPIEAAHFQNNPTMGGLALVKRALLNGSLLIRLINEKAQQIEQ